MINSNIRAKDRIYEELPEDLKRIMNQYILSEKEHERVLQDIKKQSYMGKYPVANPKFIIVAGQTGSGKSNLTSHIYAKNNNVVIIDTDKYKAYRSDSAEILKNHLTEYAFLTAPDSYLHRDEMIEDAMKLKYNILMECATSKKDGLFIDISEIQKARYNVEFHVLGVSSINSALSVHERYEALIRLNNNAAKLTGISRHDDSFESLISSIGKEQNRKDILINVYKRGEEYPYIPEIVYSSLDKIKKFSCPVEAISYTQSKDLKRTLLTAEERYKTLIGQMKERKAPQSQINQLYEVRRRYKRIIEKDKGEK